MVFIYVEGKASTKVGDHYKLVSNFPRQEYTDPSLTLQQAGLISKVQLFIEQI